MKKPCLNPQKNVKRRRFTEKKKELFLETLTKNLSTLNFDSDPNETLNSILDKTKSTIEHVFPFESQTKNQSIIAVSPWMTHEILKARKIRDNLKFKWIKSGRLEDSVEHKTYKKIRNQVTDMKRTARRNHLLKNCEEAKGDSDKLWKVVKKAMNKKPKPMISPDFVRTVSSDGNPKTIHDKKVIANEMNRQLAGMGAKLASELKTPST